MKIQIPDPQVLKHHNTLSSLVLVFNHEVIIKITLFITTGINN